jgi:protein Mpv17
MVASGMLFGVGDIVAQQGFEHQGLNHDIHRTSRTVFYGTFIFAPLVNTWLGVVEKVKFRSAVGTAIARTGLDVFCWGSFITTVYCEC